MKGGIAAAAGLAVWLLLPAWGRASEAQAAAAAGPAQTRIVRQIDDPATGRHWLLQRDPAHPGGPGRLIAVLGRIDEGGTNVVGWRAAASSFQPVILAGDRLTVTQEAAVVSAQLEAVALQPAAAGKEFKVRLKFYGKVLTAVALGSGRATLVAGTGGWR